MDQKYSPSDYFNKLMIDHTPILSFAAWKGSFSAWQESSVKRLWQLLGYFPDPAALNPRLVQEWTDGPLHITKVILSTDELTDMPVLVMRHQDLEVGKRHPAILCIHGHGHQGKDSVAGLRDIPGVLEDNQAMNNDYGRQMALEGFITIMPDLRGFGERKGEDYPDRDRCNVNFLKGAMIGVYPMTLNLFDLMRCIDYLETLPDVDPSRIGAMGLSLGGTMTTLVSALDRRIKAADIIGYVNPFYEFAIKRANFCGSQMVPHLYSFFDTHDIAGLIAPRPLLVEIGKEDLCFYHQDLKTGYEALKKIYLAANAVNKLELDDHLGGHQFSGRKAKVFFKDFL
jgi:hypothetical protein